MSSGPIRPSVIIGRRSITYRLVAPKLKHGGYCAADVLSVMKKLDLFKPLTCISALSTTKEVKPTGPLQSELLDLSCIWIWIIFYWALWLTRALGDTPTSLVSAGRTSGCAAAIVSVCSSSSVCVSTSTGSSTCSINIHEAESEGRKEEHHRSIPAVNFCFAPGVFLRAEVVFPEQVGLSLLQPEAATTMICGF